MLRKVVEDTKGKPISETIPPISAVEIFKDVADDLVKKKVFTAEDKKVFLSKIADSSIVTRAVDNILYDMYNK